MDDHITGRMGRGSAAPVEVVTLKYRSVNKLSELVPKSLAEGVEIKEFHDLNSVVLSGDVQKVSQIRAFLDSLDRRVPLVTIEVMIVDATKQRLMEIGVDAGFGKPGAPSGGTLAGVDVKLNSSDVNKLINQFNGFGSVNIGKVGPGFYMELQFLEDNGIIDMQSTPKLSTLNGHEATLTSGETRYYKEMANNYYGSQIPISTESYNWKPIEANLEIKITPYVSEDRQITLDISIDQTEFTSREVAEAPPGTATRQFKSLIRVQNEDMVLLGGIDQNIREKSNRGLPWIARVPVIRWFFGKSRDNKSERRLNVFIKPTLVE
jgi:type IV pilus assembly protein PilQ